MAAELQEVTKCVRAACIAALGKNDLEVAGCLTNILAILGEVRPEIEESVKAVLHEPSLQLERLRWRAQLVEEHKKDLDSLRAQLKKGLDRLRAQLEEYHEQAQASAELLQLMGILSQAAPPPSPRLSGPT
ncbi:hypothetical protein WJX72_002850 [[Myrmecia] bisecta]|uniref:Uncharacterized protein n=1 Tax=[Myrmecia] bisecta TaxID=41462 RepID=A0AAW1PPE9_9CHLO